jgi:hypothetical protein
MSAPLSPPATAPVHVNVLAIVIPPAVFYGLALFVFSLRIHARQKATGLQLDDAFLSMAMVSILSIGHSSVLDH